MPFRDRFLHQLPASLGQRPYPATGQIPQPFVSVAFASCSGMVALVSKKIHTNVTSNILMEFEIRMR